LDVQAGIRWPELLDYLDRAQQDKVAQWGIRQKQTGADRLSIGGALSANAHGRGLRFKPMIADVESFRLVDANGTLLTCSRTQNPKLFRLAIGGRRRFGVVLDDQLPHLSRQDQHRAGKGVSTTAPVPAAGASDQA